MAGMKRKGKKQPAPSTPEGADPSTQPPSTPTSKNEDRHREIAEAAIENLKYGMENAQAVEAERFQRSLRVKPSKFVTTKPKK